MTSHFILFRSYRSLLFRFRTVCVFEPFFGGLGTMCDVHFGLIGKSVADYLLVLIELLSLVLPLRRSNYAVSLTQIFR